jgi:hypothetical protein
MEVVKRTGDANNLQLVLRPVGEPRLTGVNRDIFGAPALHVRNEELVRHLAATDPEQLRALARNTGDPETANIVEQAIADADAAAPQNSMTVGGRQFGPLTPQQTLDGITSGISENALPHFATAWADLRGRIEELMTTSKAVDEWGDEDVAEGIYNANDMRMLAALGGALPEKGGLQTLHMLLSTMERMWGSGAGKASLDLAAAGDRDSQLALLMVQDLVRGLKHPMAQPSISARIDDSIDVLLGNTTRRATGRTDLMNPIVADDAAYEAAGFLTPKTMADLNLEPGPALARPAAPAQEAVGTALDRGGAGR